MKENLPGSQKCRVYPGEYIPNPEVEALLSELKAPHTDLTAQPLVNMDEFTDCFKIEVMVPGVSRENIFIHVHDNIISIVVLHKNCESLKKKLQIHEYDAKCFERHILLPENADAGFGIAEYRDGVLSLHIPKSQLPQKNITNQIVVY